MPLVFLLKGETNMPTIANVVLDVVSSSKREILFISLREMYVYIPMTKEEAELFAPDVINPCWRILMNK